MLSLIYGGSASGKSVFAEQLADAYYNQLNTKYYVATMQAFDEESKKRIQKHQWQRKDKHFTTLEVPMNVGRLCDDYLSFHQEKGSHPVKEIAQDHTILGHVFLVECMSNLLANELFSNDWREDGMSDEQLFLEIKNRIIEPLISLSHQHHVIVVSNDIFADGAFYEDEGMKQYVKAFGLIHQQLAKEAWQVVKVVASIPVYMKGEMKNMDSYSFK